MASDRTQLYRDPPNDRVVLFVPAELFATSIVALVSYLMWSDPDELYGGVRCEEARRALSNLTGWDEDKLLAIAKPKD